MSIAETTRDAVRRQPFLLDALRAGVLNYSAAAAFLDVEGDDDAVATALRRFGEELPAFETSERDARVTMQSGVGFPEADAESDDDGAALLAVAGTVLTDGGSLSAVLATGAVDTTTLVSVCSRLAAEDVETHAAAVAGESLVIVVDRRDGANALQAMESALSTVPS
ncbi:MAG: hypothetical protein V5A38_07600 [Halolamina sp.]|uniref:DUF7523 family protein n=1 Tax=Halolamina sp. TaxID=1940283 RepID=UPI002FC368FB